MISYCRIKFQSSFFWSCSRNIDKQFWRQKSWYYDIEIKINVVWYRFQLVKSAFFMIFLWDVLSVSFLPFFDRLSLFFCYLFETFFMIKAAIFYIWRKRKNLFTSPSWSRFWRCLPLKLNRWLIGNHWN